MKLVVKTFHGLEDVLAKELESLGAKDIYTLKRAVSFNGSKELLYKSNLHLRTALRIMLPVYTFSAYNENELYQKVGDFDWSDYIKLDQTFAIDSVVFSDYFRHSKYLVLKIKDAIVDQFRRKTGKRPSIDTETPDVRFNVYVSHENFTISLDSSGDSLHKRGYRNNQHKAPLNEVLAAGMLKLAGWNKDIPLIDPMCGSGTILMEAAMIARNMPPGINRKRYGFMKWNDYDPTLWDRVYNKAQSQIVRPMVKIMGSDISSEAIDISKVASINFNLNPEIRLTRSPFKDLHPTSKTGMLIMNPPYGERMEQDDIFSFYKMIGDHLKKNFTGFDAWILSSNKEALKHIGLHPSKKHTLFNGPLECKFQKFSLYQGSLKNTKGRQGLNIKEKPKISK